jgi:hypothetical protein
MGLFSKKDKSPAPSDGGEDPNRNALFGGRKNSPAPSTPSSAGGNPYAPARSPAPPSSSPYVASSGGGGSGYGGYGGYGGGGVDRHASVSTFDSNRDALFGNRQQQALVDPPQKGGYDRNEGYARSEGAGGAPPAAASAGGQNQSGGYGNSSGYQSGGYGQDYDKADRQLTAEEEEEEDVDAIKQQIRFTKQESVSSTRNALRVAAQAEETGRNTLARLGAQGERLYNTEKNLDVASNHNRVAEEKARELKTLNGSMFAIHMKNPMRSSARAAEEEARILSRHQSERDEREKTRQFGYESRARVGNALNQGYQPSVGRPKVSVAEMSKYQFEGDESDDEKEKEISNNLDQLGNISGRLKNLALATRDEVDRQNKQIDIVTQKVKNTFLICFVDVVTNNKQSDKVDDGIAITHNRIKKIH